MKPEIFRCIKFYSSGRQLLVTSRHILYLNIPILVLNHLKELYVHLGIYNKYIHPSMKIIYQELIRSIILDIFVLVIYFNQCFTVEVYLEFITVAFI